MKYLKLTIALLVVVAAGGGLAYYFTRPTATGAVQLKGSTIKQQTIAKDIEERIKDAPNSKFCPSAYDDILKRINCFFEDEPSNLKTYTLMLQGAYTRKFVNQANYVFDGRIWDSGKIGIICKEMNRCLAFFPDDNGLDSIAHILKEYDKLVRYNGEIKTACSQRPKCETNPNYLYIDDDWDITKTNVLINSVPNVTSKAKNSPTYQQTRKKKVEERLKNAHKQFIEDKMTIAEKEAIGYNYNSARKSDYDKLGSKLYVNFRTYASQWGEAKTTVSAWQQRVASWEQYVIQKTSTH